MKTRFALPKRTVVSRPAWEEEPTPAGKVAKWLTLSVAVILILLPLYVVVLTSLSTEGSVTRAGGLVVVPDEFSPAAYIQIFSGGVVTRAVVVSLGVTLIGTALSVGITMLAAYGLSRPGTFMHKPLLFAVLLTFLFGPGIIPSYLMVDSLGLINSYASLILPTAISAFNLIVMRAFFMNIPGELIDSARVDGANEFRIFRQIVMPLSKAVTAVVALFYGVGYWNAFFNAMLYLNDNNKWPLQMVLRTYIVAGAAAAGRGRRHAGQRQRIRPGAVPGPEDGGRRARGRPRSGDLSVRAAALHQGRHDRRGQGLTGADLLIHLWSTPCGLSSGSERAPHVDQR